MTVDMVRFLLYWGRLTLGAFSLEMTVGFFSDDGMARTIRQNNSTNRAAKRTALRGAINHNLQAYMNNSSSNLTLHNVNSAIKDLIKTYIEEHDENQSAAASAVGQRAANAARRNAAASAVGQRAANAARRNAAANAASRNAAANAASRNAAANAARRQAANANAIMITLKSMTKYNKKTENTLNTLRIKTSSLTHNRKNSVQTAINQKRTRLRQEYNNAINATIKKLAAHRANMTVAPRNSSNNQFAPLSNELTLNKNLNEINRMKKKLKNVQQTPPRSREGRRAQYDVTLTSIEKIMNKYRHPFYPPNFTTK